MKSPPRDLLQPSWTLPGQLRQLQSAGRCRLPPKNSSLAVFQDCNLGISCNCVQNTPAFNGLSSQCKIDEEVQYE